MDIRKDYQKDFESKQAWGLHTLIDAKSCNDFIKDKERIRNFVITLCDIIDMKRYGECEVVHFGSEPKVEGYSMIQLIETSLIAGHFANETNSAYIDIHSCKCYDPYQVREFVKMFFKPTQIIMQVVNRG